DVRAPGRRLRGEPEVGEQLGAVDVAGGREEAAELHPCKTLPRSGARTSAVAAGPAGWYGPAPAPPDLPTAPPCDDLISAPGTTGSEPRARARARDGGGRARLRAPVGTR